MHAFQILRWTDKPFPLASPFGYFRHLASDSVDDKPVANVKPAASVKKSLARLGALAEMNLMPNKAEHSAFLKSADEGAMQ